MSRYPAAVILAAVLPLAGWGGCSSTVKPVVPKVVYVEVIKTVGVPKELTKPCPVTRAKSRVTEQVVSAYNANIPVLEDCDQRMREIRELPTDPPAAKKP